ncbi:MAG: pantetheine-phosphate adenylyltransferase [Acidobacteria bacterium]|nr:pantetheine-phosphate adenylyltransferase [Acidobacteriota bacterium]
MAKAVYPGSFDPITNGHIDIIHRGMRIFDQVVVGILINEDKHPLFGVEERMELIRETIGDDPALEIRTFSGLLVNFMKEIEADIVVRGIRAVSDYEYELQMALMNRELSPNIETLFMLPSVEYTYVSSRLIKEVFSLGGDVSNLVPPAVLDRLRAKLR